MRRVVQRIGLVRWEEYRAKPDKRCSLARFNIGAYMVLFGLILNRNLGRRTMRRRGQNNGNPIKDNRVLWLYEGGWFEQLGDKRWIEVNRDVFHVSGSHQFHEVGRSADFVELHDGLRNLGVRLGSAAMFWRQGTEGSRNQLYPGRWQDIR